MPINPRNVIDEDDPRVSQIGHPAPAWLVNYADLMTELVIFFVVLYALSAALNKDIQKARQEIEEMMQQQEVSGDVKVDREGLHITFEERGQAGFFESGRADLTPTIVQLLDKVAPTLQGLAAKHEIVVEGHTDDVPIATSRHASNWELSTARATEVVRYLILKKALPPARLAAIGYGEYRPVVSNDSPGNRTRNRRVVFFVKSAPVKSAG
ncbi:MAG: OmpA family protein [Elusimicrobia bacterium]|nr:OmpA family protein [Elusimicrobiota bacterium]